MYLHTWQNVFVQILKCTVWAQYPHHLIIFSFRSKNKYCLSPAGFYVHLQIFQQTLKTLQFMNIWSSSLEFLLFSNTSLCSLQHSWKHEQRKFRIMFHKILQWLTGDIPRLKRPHTFFEAWIRCKCGACYIPTLCKIYATYPKKYAKYLQHTKNSRIFATNPKLCKIFATYPKIFKLFTTYEKHLRQDWRIILQCVKSLLRWQCDKLVFLFFAETKEEID